MPFCVLLGNEEIMVKIKKWGVLIFCFFIFTGIVWAENIEVYFSPKGNCAEEIIEEISKAKESINISMYYFTSRELADMLVWMKERGVKVRLYLDKSQETGKYSKASFLMNNGIQVKFKSGSGLMHNKFCVIDDKTIITGSYNWTKNAEERNDENVIILHDSDVAEIFQKQFRKYWGEDLETNIKERTEYQEVKKKKPERKEESRDVELRENFFTSIKPPLMNFDMDIGEEFMDSEDDELETGDYKYLTTTLKLDQKINFRLDYTVGIKQRWKDYEEKNRDNQASIIFLDMNYRLSEPWTLSFGLEEEIKSYKDIGYDYNEHGIWTRIEFEKMPWQTWFKTGYALADYKNIDNDKKDFFYEVGTSRYLFSKQSSLDMKYKFFLRDYERTGKGNKIKQAVHVGFRHQF